MAWSHGNFDHHVILLQKKRSVVNKINSPFSWGHGYPQQIEFLFGQHTLDHGSTLLFNTLGWIF